MKAGLFSLHYCKIQKFVVQKGGWGVKWHVIDKKLFFCLHLSFPSNEKDTVVFLILDKFQLDRG